jgi:hypothetical protein
MAAAIVQWIILALIATPLLILARDAYDRRAQRRQLRLALGVLAAVLANLALTIALGP